MFIAIQTWAHGQEIFFGISYLCHTHANIHKQVNAHTHTYIELDFMGFIHKPCTFWKNSRAFVKETCLCAYLNPKCVCNHLLRLPSICCFHSFGTRWISFLFFVLDWLQKLQWLQFESILTGGVALRYLWLYSSGQEGLVFMSLYDLEFTLSVTSRLIL